MLSITITIKQLAILIKNFFVGTGNHKYFLLNIFDNEIFPNENFLDYSNPVLFGC